MRWCSTGTGEIDSGVGDGKDREWKSGRVDENGEREERRMAGEGGIGGGFVVCACCVLLLL